MRKIAITAAAALLAAAAAFVGTSYALAPAAPADITLADTGCVAASFTLPATREPLITVRNTAAEPMVFTIPKIDRWVSVPPHADAQFELPRYIMGSFTAFCLTERQHTAIGGGNPLLCSLQPEDISPYALSSVAFTIATHDRIRELLDQIR